MLLKTAQYAFIDYILKLTPDKSSIRDANNSLKLFETNLMN